MSEPLAKQSPQDIVNELGQKTKVASRILAQTSETDINAILQAIAKKLRENVPAILEGNQKDLAAGE